MTHRFASFALILVTVAGCQTLSKNQSANIGAAGAAPCKECQQSQQAAAAAAAQQPQGEAVQQAVLWVPVQSPGGVQQAVFIPQPIAASAVQLVAYPAPTSGGACPNCPPAGQGRHGFHDGHGLFHHAGNYGPGPHAYGGGTFPYGSPYDHGHPGRPFDGGRYGYAGGAHGTPGYPHHHFSRNYIGPQGPPTAQVAYPYYTTRGPRDFLLDNPPSIGR